MMMPPLILRSVSNSTTSSVRTSRRSSSPAPLTGSPARPFNTKTLRTLTRASLRTKTMRTRMSSAMTATRRRNQMTRHLLEQVPGLLQPPIASIYGVV
ncbi:hypothetical protein IG631_11595 [Alternaria alternata]|nr:hypothetical protein IG631_11595 [Alternaria alternata]